eukprot:677953-Hanusia_phi.AAC.1
MDDSLLDMDMLQQELGKVMDKSDDLQRKLQELLHATDQFFADDLKVNVSLPQALKQDLETSSCNLDPHGEQLFEHYDYTGTLSQKAQGNPLKTTASPCRITSCTDQTHLHGPLYSIATPLVESDSKTAGSSDPTNGLEAWDDFDWRSLCIIAGSQPGVIDHRQSGPGGETRIQGHGKIAPTLAPSIQLNLHSFLTSHLSAISEFDSKVRRRMSRLAMYTASKKFSSATRVAKSRDDSGETIRSQQTMPYSEYEKLEFVNRELTRKLGSALKYKIECEELRQAMDGCWSKIAELEGENRRLRAETNLFASERQLPTPWAPDQQLVAMHMEPYHPGSDIPTRHSLEEILQLRAEVAENRREVYKANALLEMYKEENIALQEKLEGAENKLKVLMERGVNM